MRLFIAVELPLTIKDYLAQLQDKLKNQDATVKWVHESTMHLTLKFLGEVAEKDIEGVKEKLKTVQFEKFTLTLSELGVFPHEKSCEKNNNQYKKIVH